LPRYLALVVGVIAAASLSAWLLIFLTRSDGAKSIRDEMVLDLAKSLGQLFFVTLLGGAVTLLYNRHAKELDERRAKDEKEQEARAARLAEDNRLRRDLLVSLIKVRGGVEAARRQYNLLPPDRRAAGYRVAVGRLLTARLQLSGVWHDTETWKELFPGGGAAVTGGLENMKKYLDSIVGEYETRVAKPAAGSPTAQDADPPVFGAFVKAGEGSVYEAEFLARDYRGAARAIRDSIVAAPG
jgi:hypothetical protein